MHTDLETGGERQKCKILVKIFVKVQKNLKNFGQNRNFVVYCSSRKMNLVDVTKKTIKKNPANAYGIELNDNSVLN